MKKVIFVVLCLVVLSSFYGCETVKGVGKDITSLGEAMSG